MHGIVLGDFAAAIAVCSKCGIGWILGCTVNFTCVGGRIAMQTTRKLEAFTLRVRRGRLHRAFVPGLCLQTTRRTYVHSGPGTYFGGGAKDESAYHVMHARQCACIHVLGDKTGKIKQAMCAMCVCVWPLSVSLSCMCDAITLHAVIVTKPGWF